MLGIADDGSYRVMSAPEKVFFSGRLIHCAPFDPDRSFEFTVVYRGRHAHRLWQARARGSLHPQSRVPAREGREGPGRPAARGRRGGIASLEFVPAPRQRVKSARFDLTRLELTGIGAKGTRLAPKPVAKLKLLARKPKRKPADPPKPGPKARRPRAAKGQTSLF